MSEERTINSIMDYFHLAVQTKQVITPDKWVDAAQMANVLISDEHDKLYELHQVVAKLKVAHIEEDKSVAQANALVEATDEYKAFRKQKAKIGQIEEFVRIAKIQARLKETEYHNN